jgi:hypothetical protein
MKKIWIILSSILAIIVLVVGFMQWQESTKYTMVPRTFTVQTTEIPDAYKDMVPSIIESNIKAKLAAMTFDAATPHVVAKDGTQVLEVTVPKGITNNRILEAVNQPLDFAIMIEVPKAEAELILSETDETGYNSTGIVTEHVEWVEYGDGPENKAAMRIVLSEAGQELLKNVYEQHEDKQIGIIMRNRLVAKLLVKSSNFDKDIRIFGIPDRSIAQLVADDMITSRYVTFSQ